MSALLEIRDLEVTYNRVAKALHGVSLDVGEQSVVAVLGSNGAGKSTTLRAVSGFLRSENGRVTAGSVSFHGRKTTGKPPHQLARLGLGIVPERNKVFATLTVKDNLASVSPRRGGSNRGELEAFIFDLFPALGQRLGRQAGLLSGGERQMLAVARALLLEPTLILADELSFGIAPIMLERLLDALRTIKTERGISVLLVEQNAPAAFAVADYVYVMEAGRIAMAGTPIELQADSNIRQVYFGLDPIEAA